MYRLYGSEVSYFTAKVRPALRYKRVPFAEILATPDVYRKVIQPRTGLRFIPIVVTPDDETWQDDPIVRIDGTALQSLREAAGYLYLKTGFDD